MCELIIELERRSQHLQHILITLVNFNVVDTTSGNDSSIFFLRGGEGQHCNSKKQVAKIILLQRGGGTQRILASFLRQDTVLVRDKLVSRYLLNLLGLRYFEH